MTDIVFLCVTWITYKKIEFTCIWRYKVKTQDRVRESVALVDWHRVRHAIAAVHHNPGGAAAGVERKDRLDGNVHGRHVEGLEHDLRHALTVRLRVQRRLGQEHRVLLWGHAELVVEPLRSHTPLNVA